MPHFSNSDGMKIRFFNVRKNLGAKMQDLLQHYRLAHVHAIILTECGKYDAFLSSLNELAKAEHFRVVSASLPRRHPTEDDGISEHGGVMVLLAEHIPDGLLVETRTIERTRIVTVTFAVPNSDLIVSLCGFYLPTGNLGHFKKCFDSLVEYINGQKVLGRSVIAGGDGNFILRIAERSSQLELKSEDKYAIRVLKSLEIYDAARLVCDAPMFTRSECVRSTNGQVGYTRSEIDKVFMCKGLAKRMTSFRIIPAPMIGYSFDHDQVEVVLRLGDRSMLDMHLHTPSPRTRNIPEAQANDFICRLDDRWNIQTPNSVRDSLEAISEAAVDTLIRPSRPPTLRPPREIAAIKKNISRIYIAKKLIAQLRAARGRAEKKKAIRWCSRNTCFQWVRRTLGYPRSLGQHEIQLLFEDMKVLLLELIAEREHWESVHAHDVAEARAHGAKSRARKQLTTTARGAQLDRPFVAIRRLDNSLVWRPAAFRNEVARQHKRRFTPAPIDEDLCRAIIARTPTNTEPDLSTCAPITTGTSLRQAFATANVVAADVYGLNAEIWRLVPTDILDHIAMLHEYHINRFGSYDPAMLVSKCVMKDKNHPDPYLLGKKRPIENQPSLTTAIGRAEFASHQPVVGKILSPKHFGAIPGRSIQLAAIMSDAVLEYCRVQQTAVSVLSLDMRDMFVRPVFKVIEQVFHDRLPRRAASILLSSFRNRKAIVDTTKGPTVPVKAKCGLGQGFISSAEAAVAYNDGVTRGMDRGNCSQARWQDLTPEDYRLLEAEGIPVIGGVPCGVVVLTDDHNAIRIGGDDNTSRAADKFCDEIRAMGGDVQADKMFCVAYGKSRRHHMSQRRTTSITCQGRPVRTHFKSERDGLEAIMKTHGGFPIEAHGRCPSLLSHFKDELQAAKERLSPNYVFMTTADVGGIISGCVQAKVTHLGATLKFSPRDIWELDKHCHGLIRKKFSLAKGTTPHWFSAPVALGGFGWLDIADRMYREFLLYYAASFNDNKADGELRQVKRTVHYMTLNAAGGRFAHLSLSDVTNPEWNLMYAAEKLAMIGEYFDLIPVTASTFERTFSRPLRPLPLIEPALNLHKRSFVAGTDGAEEDGIASYAFTIAELDLSSHISYGDRIVGDQAVHRAELIAILMLLCYSFLASDVTIYVDRQAATDAIVKAEQDYARNPNALHRTSEGGILTLIVSILALIRARGSDNRTFRHQAAHYYDEVDLDEIKDALNPGPWLNRKADLKADKKLSNPNLDYDLYEGEIAGDDMFFVRGHDEIISTSLRRDFKHAAQYRHLELAYGDTRVDTSLPVPGADTTFESIHESLEPFVHPISHFAFTDPNLKNQSIWRAFILRISVRLSLHRSIAR